MTAALHLFSATLHCILFVIALTHLGKSTRIGWVRDLCGAAGAFFGAVGFVCTFALMLQVVLGVVCLVVGGCE